MRSETGAIINFRAPTELVERLDDLARREQRTRANAILTILRRVTDPSVPEKVLEFIITALNDQLEKHGDTAYTEWQRGQLHAAKWMVHAILGEEAKDRALNAIRKKTGQPIPHVVPLFEDGNRYGFDSDAG